MTWILDTSVMIDWLRRNDDAAQLLLDCDAEGGRFICSAMSIVELSRGFTPAQKNLMRTLQSIVEVQEVDNDVMTRASEFAEQWGRAHNAIDAVDFVIAATADVTGGRLLTLNVKHFPMFDNLMPPY